MSTGTEGMLYIVATPIGNLQDITYRAIAALNTVDLIAAEDTRHSKHLLEHYAINTPLQALHAHNESTQTAQLLKQLKAGKSIALISDAGTPLINDPGYLLVKQAHEIHCRVIPIPGACAIITALSAAGLPTQRFSFEGFLPARALARRKILATLQYDTRTLIFYEAPHRLAASLADMQASFGDDRQAVLARELTKKFETICKRSLAELTKWVKSNPTQQKGECVILIQGAVSNKVDAIAKTQAAHILKLLMTDLPTRQAIDLTVKITGLSKNDIYVLAHPS